MSTARCPRPPVPRAGRRRRFRRPAAEAGLVDGGKDDTRQPSRYYIYVYIYIYMRMISGSCPGKDWGEADPVERARFDINICI